MRDVSNSDISSFLTKINDVGDSVTKVISQWTTNQEERCYERIKSKTPDLRKYIFTEYDSFLRQQFSSGGLDSEGEFVRRINTVNKSALIKNILNSLWNEAGRMVGNKSIRIDLTVKSLTSIGELLDSQIKSFNDDYKRAEIQANKWLQKMERSLQIIAESENAWFYRSLTLRTYVRHVFNAMRSYLNMRARMLIDETAISVCEEIKNHIGYEAEITTTDGKVKVERFGIILDLRQLENLLNTLKARIHEKFESFDRPEQSVIHINLYQKGDFGDFYIVNNSAVDESVLAEIDDEFFTSTSIGGLIGLNELFQSPGIAHVEREIVDFCKTKFKELKSKSESDAIKTFMKRYADEQQRIQMINRFYTMGAGWLKRGSHFMGDPGITNNIKSMAYIGMASKLDGDYEEFMRLFRRFNNTADRTNVDSSLVCYYSEHAGIPLMYINDLDKSRQSYLELAKRPGSGLHIDRFDEKFADIMLKTDSEIGILREAIRILLVGSILGIIEVFEDRDNQLSYKYMKGRNQPVPLGTEHMAVEMIRSNFAFRAELDHKITDMVNNFDQTKLFQYYIILEYYTNELFKPKFYKVGMVIEEKLSHEHRALYPVKEEIRNSLLATMTEEEFEERISVIKQNLNDFSLLVSGRRILK